jgi:hypothetical protein
MASAEETKPGHFIRAIHVEHFMPEEHKVLLPLG